MKKTRLVQIPPLTVVAPPPDAPYTQVEHADGYRTRATVAVQAVDVEEDGRPLAQATPAERAAVDAELAALDHSSEET